MHVVSKFRVEYWIQQSFNILLGIIIAGLCVYFIIQFEYETYWFWGGFICLISGAFYFRTSLFDEIRQLIITDTGITIKYFIPKKSRFVNFSEIKNFSTTRIIGKQGAGTTPGYHRLEIELTTGPSIIFDENQFENFMEIKGSIYVGQQNLDT